MKAPKILIFKLGLLGDVLMTTPFVRSLRRSFPASDIQYWVGKSYRVALSGNPHLSKVVAFDDDMFYQRDFAAVLELWRQLRRERFDIAFLLGKHWIFNVLAASLGIPCRIGFAREKISRLFLTHAVRFHELRHEVLYYLDLLKFVGAPDYSDLAMEVRIPNEDLAYGDSLITRFETEDFVAVINSGGNNAGENQFVRRLPDDFFRDLVKRLCQRQQVVLLGNATDRTYYNRFAFPPAIANWAGQLSFPQSLAVMKRASRIYATDCGALHMAAAVNNRITAFFGPAHPQRKAPFGPEVEVIWPGADSYNSQYDLYNTQPLQDTFRNISYPTKKMNADNTVLELACHE